MAPEKKGNSVPLHEEKPNIMTPPPPPTVILPTIIIQFGCHPCYIVIYAKVHKPTPVDIDF
jgi:hypothetical protein